MYYVGVSINGGTPTLDGLYGKIPLKRMTWGYPYFRKPPYVSEYLSRASPVLPSTVPSSNLAVNHFPTIFP